MTLAEYQQAKQKDLHSRDSNCGALPEKMTFTSCTREL